MRLRFVLAAHDLAIARLAPAGPLPAWTLDLTGFWSLTATGRERSLVCAHALLPPGTEHDAGWSALRVEVRHGLDLPGVTAAITAPVAAAGLPLFVLGTFETDHLLVRTGHLDPAAAALRGAGHTVDLHPADL